MIFETEYINNGNDDPVYFQTIDDYDDIADAFTSGKCVLVHMDTTPETEYEDYISMVAYAEAYGNSPPEFSFTGYYATVPLENGKLAFYFTMPR